MSDAGGSGTTYVVPVARVRESIEVLLAQKIHTYFIAYLQLRRAAAQVGRTTNLDPGLASLASALEMNGGPPGKPYLRPFWHHTRDAGQEWLNANIAGSYGPSSLRKVQLRVVDTDAAGKFSLRENHWELARKELLFGAQVPVLALAAFLFRDYGLLASSQPTASDLVDLFRDQYGYRSEDDVEFEHLYDSGWPGESKVWAELFLSFGSDL